VTTRLADIAAQAGVSEATVSRVLNGKPGVAATTRQTVLAALDVLGYERPVRLRQRSEGLVGLITPELENPIFPALAQVIGQALTRQGYTPVLATQTPGGSTEDELTEMLVDRGVAGIIFVSGLHADTSADMQRYDQLRAQGVPFVLVDGFSPKVQAPLISPDDRAAMALQAEFVKLRAADLPALRQHLRANVAGVSALGRGMAILPAERDVASGEDAAHRREEGRRRTDEKLAAERGARRGGALLELARQCRTILEQAVHFPIACDELHPYRHVATPLRDLYHLADTITPAFRRVNRSGPAERGHLPPCFKRSARERDLTSSGFCSRS